MSGPFRIDPTWIEEQNRDHLPDLDRDYAFLGDRLARRGIDIGRILAEARRFAVAIPSWALATGGTRFGRFPLPGEPRDVFEKLDDAACVHRLVRCAPAVSLHIPWDRPEDPAALRAHAGHHGLGFDAINSNTFEDQPGQLCSYKFGSLSHTEAAVRRQAIAHNLACIEIGEKLGSRALTVWIADGASFPGQQDFRGALDRYIESMRAIYAALPGDWRLFIEYKLFEPAFYATVINDWGTAYWCSRELGEKASCLIDLGHHAPTTNIEMIVSRLAQCGKLGGFHFNDSKYGDDDLDAGSIAPYRLFLVFNELLCARKHDPDLAPALMIDQSHNVTDPIESMIMSAVAIQRAYAASLLVDRKVIEYFQQQNDALMARRCLEEAFRTDVSPLLAMARLREGGAIDPVAAYRESGYRAEKAVERRKRA